MWVAGLNGVLQQRGLLEKHAWAQRGIFYLECLCRRFLGGCARLVFVGDQGGSDLAMEELGILEIQTSNKIGNGLV
jgi:hypothetical protein